MISSCFASYFFDQIEGEIEEGLNRNGFCDMSQLLPSVLNAKDSNDLTSIFQKKLQSTPLESIVMAESYLISKKFLKALSSKFQSKMEESSEVDLKKQNYVLAFRTEHAVVGGNTSSQPQASSSSSSKSTKSKGKKVAAAAESNDEMLVEITFINKQSLINELKSLITNEITDDLLSSLVEYFLK
jgi:hypothetical protein